MRTIKLWLCALGVICPLAAAAAPSPQDTKVIETCLNADSEALGAQCIGIVADPCIKAAANEDASKACAARELAVWEEELKTALKAVTAGGFKEIIAAVAQAQKSWRESREKLCPTFDKIEPGMFVGGANYCRLQETARRVLLLRKLGAAVNEH